MNLMISLSDSPIIVVMNACFSWNIGAVWTVNFFKLTPILRPIFSLFWFFVSLYLSLCAFVSVPFCDLVCKILWPRVYNSNDNLSFKVFLVTTLPPVCKEWPGLPRYSREEHELNSVIMLDANFTSVSHNTICKCVCRVWNDLYHYHYRWRGVMISCLMEKQRYWDKESAV